MGVLNSNAALNIKYMFAPCKVLYLIKNPTLVSSILTKCIRITLSTDVSKSAE